MVLDGKLKLWHLEDIACLLKYCMIINDIIFEHKRDRFDFNDETFLKSIQASEEEKEANEMQACRREKR